MILRVLLFFQLVYVVNQLHFPWETGIPAVAPANLLFIAILIAMRGQPDQLKLDGMLRRPLAYFGGALVLAFIYAQLRAPKDSSSAATRRPLSASISITATLAPSRA